MLGMIGAVAPACCTSDPGFAANLASRTLASVEQYKYGLVHALKLTKHTFRLLSRECIN